MTSESPSTDSGDISVESEGQTYLVRHEGSDLRVGRRSGDTVLWQDETVPVADLPDAAREELESGQTGSAELQLALEAILQAFIKRGG